MVQRLCLVLMLMLLQGWRSVEGNIGKEVDPLGTVFREEDIVGRDQLLIGQLTASVKRNVLRGKCNAVTPSYELIALNASYITNLTQIELKHGGLGLVSPPRKRTTALLTKAALTLPQRGDIVETGCYVGTSASIMLKILFEFDSCDRKLWVFDSFRGLPPPTKEDHQQGDAGAFFATEDVFIENLKVANLYDPNRLVITKGWFNETCHISPVQKIAFLRLDGDLFTSTWDALTALYHRVVPGGYIYVDDYGSFRGCREAIDKFRTQHKIFEPLHFIHESETPETARNILFEAVWWMKSGNGKPLVDA